MLFWSSGPRLVLIRDTLQCQILILEQFSDDFVLMGGGVGGQDPLSPAPYGFATRYSSIDPI